MAAPLDAALVMPAGTATAANGGPTPVSRDAAAVDPFFAAAGKADQTLSLAGHSARAHQAAENGDLDVLPEAIWLLD
jgi:hypothetical protein